MYPGFNSFPRRPNQVPGNQPAQQVFTSNPSARNASNMLPNGMQMQPQMGLYPQNLAALNGLLAQLSNGANQLLALQNNQLAMQQLMGFSAQNNVQNFNAVPGQFFNMGQSTNPMNLLRPVSGQMVFPNLPFSAPAMQNVNQLRAIQMPNSSQVPHYNGSPYPNQPVGPDLRQQINPSQQYLPSPTIGTNSYGPLAATGPQLHENHAATLNPRLDQAKGSPQLPPLVYNKSQENRSGKGGANSSNFNNSPIKEFMRNPRTEGFQKSHFQHMKNGKRKFDHADGRGGKESSNEKAQAGNHRPINQAYEKKRVVTYSEQEIKQWREERRKNHPANMKEKLMGPKTDDTVAKFRCEQLKEILSKQAELGVEVAEIPAHYFAGSENRGPRREDNRRPYGKDRFQNKHGKRGRHNQRERYTKKQKFDGSGSAGAPQSLKKSEPTLLKKLLGRDIKRDKLRLLQVFRFMVMNSFFKNGPEQPLKFPSVIVNENGNEGPVFEKKSSDIPEVVLEDGSEKVSAENLAGSFVDAGGSINDDNDCGEGDDCHSDVHEEEEEEEGEITD